MADMELNSIDEDLKEALFVYCDAQHGKTMDRQLFNDVSRAFLFGAYWASAVNVACQDDTTRALNKLLKQV